MTTTQQQERTFTRRLASHTLVAAASVALGSLLGFYQGRRSYEQEECVRKGMEVRFEQDFPQYQGSTEQRLIRLYDGQVHLVLGNVRASYLTGKVFSPEDATEQMTLLQNAAELGRRTEHALEQECAENSRKYRY